MPKARTARDVWWFDVLLTQLETQLGLTRRIGLEVLIEEAEGLSNAAEIARASDRLEAIIFGAGDLSASMHARVDGNFDPVGRVPGRLLAPCPGADPGRRPCRRHRRHRRAVPGLPGPRGLPPVGRARQPAGLRREVGHPSRPGPHRQRRLRPHRGRGAGTPRSRSPSTARRRPTGSAPSGGTAGWSTPPTCGWPLTSCTRPPWLPSERARFVTRPGGAAAQLPGRPVGHGQHRDPRPCGPSSSTPGSIWWGCG